LQSESEDLVNNI